jgi:hypothetical protein
MVARRKKKYQTGEGSNYISRKQALKKLQLNLKVRYRRKVKLINLHQNSVAFANNKNVLNI